MKNILWFDEIDSNDIDKVGGKGANLGEMADKFPIPSGFIVTAGAYFDTIQVKNIESKIKEVLEELDVEDTSQLQDKSDQIKEIFLETELPEELQTELLDNFKQLRGDQEQLFTAVRSSATAEDLPDASFAGQQETFLGVDEDNLIESVIKCWASLFTARAIYYRENNDFSHMDVGIAVIVQKLIEGEIAGVLFTANPSTGKNEVMIEAGYGLGDTVVGGEITPDIYTVDPTAWELNDKEIATQPFKLVREGNSTKQVELDDQIGKKQKLDDNIIIKLAKIGKDIEEHYDGQPQDIEWVYADETLYIVQSRPITTIQESNNQKNTKSMESAKVILEGLAASPGIGTGQVNIIMDTAELDQFKEGQVLVTDMTSPDWVPAMKAASAIVTDDGGTTSHAAIVSREIGVPCVVGSGNATSVLEDNQVVSVDGEDGVVYDGEIEQQESQQESTKAQSSAPAIVTATKLYVNLSSPDTAAEVAKMDVDGVGLLRAEFIAAQIGRHPMQAIEVGEEDQWIGQMVEGMSKVADAFNPRPVIYRTLDFKTNEYREMSGGEEYEPEENNPMLGYRGCFRNIHDREVFEMELKAIEQVRETKGMKNLNVMIPFVRSVDELENVITILNEHGLQSSKDFKLWIMVEVPSTVLLIDEFLKYVDGVSIGTNDLTQLILGVDRDNQRLNEIFDERDPAVMKAIGRVIQACNDQGKTSSVCGQAPTKHEEIVEFLVDQGVTSMSVSPDAINRTKKLIARMEKKELLQQKTGI